MLRGLPRQRGLRVLGLGGCCTAAAVSGFASALGLPHFLLSPEGPPPKRAWVTVERLLLLLSGKEQWSGERADLCALLQAKGGARAMRLCHSLLHACC